MDKCLETDPLDEHEIIALKNLSKGKATEYQQVLALHAITNKICRVHDNLFIPGAPDQTAFLAGRAYVGSKILFELNVPVGRMKKPEAIDENQK